MLQAIHDKAKGWVAYAIIGFICIPFALWGVNSYFSGGTTVNAAVVNGEKITAREVQNQLSRIRQQFGEMASNFDDETLKGMALDAVINRTLLRQKAAEQGYQGSIAALKANIANEPSFQTEGRFDPELYNRFLNSQGRSEAQFERSMLDNITLQQFQQGLSGTSFVTQTAAQQYKALQNQQRDLALFTIEVADFAKDITISDEQVQTYYDENQNQFMTEEQVKLAYIEVDQDKLAENITVDEETLRNYYEENSSSYVKPASRNVSHILVSVDSPAQEEAKQRIEQLYQSIESGEKTFEEVAQASSDDTLSKDEGGLVGDVVAGEWDPEFEKAVFTQAIGVVAPPVKTGVGYEIIRVNAETPAEQRDFEAVRDRVEEDYRRSQASDLFFDRLETVRTIAYEQNGDLAPAAQQAGLEVQETDWLSRNQGDGMASNSKIREAAFSEDIRSGRNSEGIELGSTRIVFVRQLDRQAAEQKPLDTVRDGIVTILRQTEARQQVAEQSAELLKQAKAEGLEAAVKASGLVAEPESVENKEATEAGNVETAASAVEEKEAIDTSTEAIEKLGFITRRASQVQAAVSDAAFAMPHPEEAQASYDSVTLSNGDVVVIALLAVKDGETTVVENDLTRFGSQLSSWEVSAALEAMRERADIERFPDNI